MNARSRKHRIGQIYSQSFKKVVKETIAKPKVSPFDAAIQNLLFKTIDPLPTLIEDNLDIVTEKRPRGRPRKQQPDTRTDHHTHKIECDDILSKTLNFATLRSMIADFRYHRIMNKIPLQPSLERIVKSYNITYKQAHSILESEF
jgi:hypothetical protein